MRTEMSNTMLVSVAALQQAVTAIFAACNVAPADALETASALVAADQEGISSHGVMMVPLYVERLQAGSVSVAQPSVMSDRETAVVLDAHDCLGQVSAAMSVDIAVRKAATYGMASVAVRNAFHFGTASRWATRIAAHGMVGIVMSNTRPLMPAPGGAQAVVGNNPLAIAVPSASGEPIVLDMAMSASAMGKIRLAQARGDTIPDTWATDATGAPTSDPAAAIAGMLLPAAGPKGFGLALMVDLLCGGLSAGAMGEAVKPLYGSTEQPYGCAHQFLALNIDHFRPVDAFSADAGMLSSFVRASRRAPGVERLYMPGEIAAVSAASNAERLSLPSTLIDKLNQTALQLGLAQPF